MFNCPNCGAPVTSHKCEYCGTVIFDFAEISMDEPSWVAVDFGDGAKRLLRVIMRDVSMRCALDAVPTITAEFILVPDDKGVHAMARIE